ncbi:MAG: SLC13 family permease [Candidatus Reddybacter sp.]
MNQEQFIVTLCLAGIIIGLSATRIRPVFLFSSAISLLYLLDMISLGDALKHYTNEALATLILLIMLVLAIEKTQLFTHLGHKVLSGSYHRVLLKLGLTAGLVSSVSNNTAVVASFMSAVKNQNKLPPSRLLIPLSYASIWGGTLTLVGTSTNLILNGLVLENGLPPLSMFDFTAIGLPIFLGCMTLLLIIAPRVLPSRAVDISESKTYFLEAKVQSDSPLIGKSLLDNGFRNLVDLFLVEIIRDQHVISPVSPEEMIEAGDLLIFSGDIENIQTLNQFKGLSIFDDDQSNLTRNLSEVVVSHNATITDRPLREVNFRAMFDAAVVAVRRGDQRLAGGLGKIKLQSGDSLVLATGHDFHSRHNLPRNFIVLGGVNTKEHLPTLTEYTIIASFIAVIALSALAILPLFKGLLIMLGGLITSRLLSVNEIRRHFPFELIIVIGAALGFAQVMQDSGVAALLADLILTAPGAQGAYPALIACFILTLLLTELVTNNAAAVLVFPIALSMASQYQTDPMPFIMAVAFGASASFISPHGYQTNLMVYSAGNYQLLDYLKTGLPISLLYATIALITIPMVYPFYP